MQSEPPLSSGGRAGVPTMTAPMAEDLRGQRLGAYVIDVAVADGSMGRVYRAQHHATGDEVAVKVLHPNVAKDEVAVERFRREYETASALTHERIVRVHDFGETEDGAHYMAMEYLEGDELGVVLDDGGAMEPARAVRILCQLALGLERAHADGIVHRDLKPDNVFVCPGESGDEIRIVDFGSVKLQVALGRKLTVLGTTLGSPCYMSPEQAAGQQDVDQRTDVFALAAILHELATGTVAFPGDEVAEILMKVVGEEPPPVSASNPAYPWAFDDVVRRGLHKDKSERFGTVMELAEATLGALGLAADVSRWARATRGELVEALGDAPAPTEIESRRPQTHPISVPALPIRSTSRGALVVMGVLGVALIATLLWAILA